jgi:hypothetical protein
MVDINQQGARKAPGATGRGRVIQERFLLLALCLTSPSLANAQPQSPASDVTALHRAVFELPESQSLPDAENVLALARLYQAGQGVPQDPILACTLFDLQVRARMNEPRGFEGLRLEQMALELKGQSCDPLSDIERQWAFTTLGCAVFGLPRGTIVELGPGWWVKFVVGDGVRVEFGGKEHEQALGVFCPVTQVVLFRHTALENAGRAGASRDFFEIATWRPGCCTANGMRVFTWYAYEAEGAELNLVAHEEMMERGSIWPVPSTRGADGARFTMLDSGHVEYQVMLDTPRRGRIGRIRAAGR